MSKLEKLYMAIGVCLTTFACIHESHAATVLHVMVYNVQTADPTEHTVIAMQGARCAIRGASLSLSYASVYAH